MASQQFSNVGGNNGQQGNPFQIPGNANYMTGGVTGFPVPPSRPVSQTLPEFIASRRTRTTSPRFQSGATAGR